MKFENTQVMNFEGAFRGLRNPLQSWDKADSFFGIRILDYSDMNSEFNITIRDWVEYDGYKPEDDDYEEHLVDRENWLTNNGFLMLNPIQQIAEIAYLGPKDINLAQRMIKAGSSDRKFLRQIMVSVDITAPLFLWKQFDTYKIGTTANSTSTMHKLASTPITRDCFELSKDEGFMIYKDDSCDSDLYITEYWDTIIRDLEYLRTKYNETKDQKYWKELIRLLPEAWLQTRTVTMNYEILRNMYSQRKNHRLTEWHDFCEWVKTLPYAEELITYNID